jgi:carbamate kinase
MISLCLNNELRRRGLTKRVSTIITSIEVAADDPAFASPTKPIGPLYPPQREADLRARGWDIAAVTGNGGGFRRVVPSPRPRAIVEIDFIRALVAQGRTFIAAGGGGVPVVRDANGDLRGREAVIDKDLASALIARGIGAEILFIVTGVAKVAIDFGTPRQRDLDSITIEEARRHRAGSQFPAGSMGPKIDAAIEFLEDSPSPRPRVIITDIAHMHDALAGQAGTIITR